ncbi:protein PAXX isoform X1 [Marmota marmota marmota]|uniref:protein PAXX isoform X1 n=1 Tax=Marmota marmota marmota TaxID=9994 RepID=UPI0007627C1D|nr:protein PAXX isoform X1 [Marmota marmota marmota]
MVPPPLSPPLCTLPPGPGPPRFVCYCEREESGDADCGGFNLYVTDAAQLWSTSFSRDSLAALKARFGLSETEDITSRFRAACHHQGVTLSFQEDRASLTLSGGPSTLVFDLSKVPGIEAAPRLQALTLGLAERVCSLEQQLAAVEKTAASPRKSPQPAGSQLFLPGKVRTWEVGWVFSFLWNYLLPKQASRLEEDLSVQIGPWQGVLLGSEALLPVFLQTPIPREVVLDLGSGNGVQGNPSSTLASKVRSQLVA